MRGSIRKRGSTFTYWLDIGPDPVTANAASGPRAVSAPSGSAKRR
jgi:hypothetical protein